MAGLGDGATHKGVWLPQGGSVRSLCGIEFVPLPISWPARRGPLPSYLHPTRSRSASSAEVGPVKRTRLVVLFDGEDKPDRLRPHLVWAHRTGFSIWTELIARVTRRSHRADGSGHDHDPSWRWDRHHEGTAPEPTTCREESGFRRFRPAPGPDQVTTLRNLASGFK